MDDVVLEPWPLRGTKPTEPTPPLTKAIESATERLTAERVILTAVRENKMPLIEIKGLSASVAAVKGSIGDLRTSAAVLNTESSALKAEIDDLTTQIKQHRTDLRFEAETLGNGSGDKTSQGGGN